MLWLTFFVLFTESPLNFLHGYLMTEEGWTYLRYARSVAGWRALTAPHQSYYSLIPNVALLLPARFLPLLLAPWIAVWTSCAVRMLVAYTVVRCEAFTTARVRFFAVVLIVLTVGSPAAVGTIHSQFFMGIVASVLLISDPRKYRVFRYSMLTMAGLEGTITGALAPFFLFRAWRAKTREAWTQAVIVCASAILQAYIVHVSFRYSTRAHMSAQPLWVYVDAAFNHLAVLSFATRFGYHALSVYLVNVNGAVGSLIAVVAVLVFSGMFWVARQAGHQAVLLLAAGLFSSLCSTVGMEGGRRISGGGERYFLVGNACIALSLLLIFASQKPGPRKLHKQVAVLLALVCVSGCIDVARYWRLMQRPLHWREQVSSWKRSEDFRFLNGPDYVVETGFPLPHTPQFRALPYYVFDSNTQAAFRQRSDSPQIKLSRD